MPTLSAVLPPTPASISSNISTGILSTSARIFFSASIILDSSPPEATFDSGLSGSPGFAEKSNSIVSMPVEDSGDGLTSTLNPAFSNASSFNIFSTALLISFAVCFLFSDRPEASFMSLPSFSLSCPSNRAIFSSEYLRVESSFSASSLYRIVESMLSPYFFSSFLMVSSLSSMVSSRLGSRSYFSLNPLNETAPSSSRGLADSRRLRVSLMLWSIAAISRSFEMTDESFSAHAPSEA